MRVVADTNTIVSALFWKGPPRVYLDLAREGRISLYTSASLLDELAQVLLRPKFAERIAASRISGARLVRRYARLTQRVIPAEIGPTVAGDLDDDAVLACALAAQADLIVSGDKRVRNLKTYQRIRIASITETLALIPKS